MAVRETLLIGDPLLKANNISIANVNDPKIIQVIEDCIDTMHANDIIGIAAPQIGENYRLFVTEPRETKSRPKDQTDILRVYINPVITYTSEEQIEIWEGCKCVPGIFAPVTRPKIISIEAIDTEGRKFELKADGILGRVIQHEQDHLEGIEFTERITDLKRITSKDFYIKLIKPLPEVQKSSVITIKEALYV